MYTRLSKRTFRIVTIVTFVVGIITQFFWWFNTNSPFNGSLFADTLTFTVIIPLYVVSLLWFFELRKIKNKLLITLISIFFSVLYGELAMVAHPLLGGGYGQMYGIVFVLIVPFAIVFGLITGVIISLLLDRY